MRVRESVGWIGLTAFIAIVLLITITPDQVDADREWVDRLLDAMHGIGVPRWFDYDQLEFTANIVMFLPIGFFLGILLHHRPWIGATIVTLFTAFIETVQLLFLPSRVASLGDVLANSLGGWIGLGATLLLYRFLAPSRRVGASA